MNLEENKKRTVRAYYAMSGYLDNIRHMRAIFQGSSCVNRHLTIDDGRQRPTIVMWEPSAAVRSRVLLLVIGIGLRFDYLDITIIRPLDEQIGDKCGIAAQYVPAKISVSY